MIKPRDSRELAVDLISRSICTVQVTAVVEDAAGNIISWGWNSVGSGFGIHAEAHAIKRANQNRLYYGTIYVAGQRLRNGRLVVAKPCEKCQELVDKWHLDVLYRDKDGSWING